MPVSRIEIGPGANPRQDWVERNDVMYVEKGEWAKLAATPAGTVEEIYMADVLGYPGERRVIWGLSAPVQLAENYPEMVRWAAAFHRVLKPGGTVIVIDDNTPMANPDRDIIEPFTEQNRFMLIDREVVDSSPWPVPGYKLVFQKPG